MLPPNPPQALGLVEPADEPQTLELRVGQRFEHDSNVFRLSSSADTAALLGTSSRSDVYGVTTLGMKFDKRYSLPVSDTNWQPALEQDGRSLRVALLYAF